MYAIGIVPDSSKVTTPGFIPVMIGSTLGLTITDTPFWNSGAKETSYKFSFTSQPLAVAMMLRSICSQEPMLLM